MRSWNYLIAASVGFFTPLLGYALTWEKTSLDIAIEAGSSELIAEFPFKNEGDKPVTIRELKASCGCTAPTVEARLVPVGEKGSVKIAYAPGNRIGPQNVQVFVTTDEVGISRAILHLKVDIQPTVSLTPRLVQWVKDDGLVSRTIEIKQLSKETVRVLGVKPIGPDTLKAELKPGTEPGKWLLTLTPKSVDSPFTTKVEIPVKIGERTMNYSVFATVR